MGQETSRATIDRYLSDHCAFLESRREARFGCVELYRDNYTKMLVIKKSLTFASRHELELLRTHLHLTEKGHKNLAHIVMASEDSEEDAIAGTLVCEYLGHDLESDIHTTATNDTQVDHTDQAACAGAARLVRREVSRRRRVVP